MTLTRARTIQYIGILLLLGLIAVGYWYFSVRAGVKTNSSALQPQGVGDLSAGLAGYWKLDEGSGTTAADASTNGNNGTFVNSPTWTTGQIGQGLTNFSTTTYVNVPHSAALNSLPLTLSFWVKTADSSAGRHIAIAKDYTDGYRCHVVSGAMRCWFLTNGGANWYDGGNGYSFGQIADNQWHLITMVISASGGVGYLDGVQAVSQSLTGSPVQAPTGTGALSIGTGSGGNPVDDFSGTLDEVRIYNRTLSADEVGQLYRLTTPTGVDTSLKGYWSFNANALSGTTAYDWSGAGKNLTLNNGPTATTGRVGQGLSFDGTNDYASGTYTPTGPNTLSAWIYPRSFADNPGIVGQLSPNYNSYGWGLSLDTSGNIHAISANDNITWYNNLVAAVPLNQWSHVTVTFSSCCNVAATGYLYINGVQVASYTGTADTYPYNFAIGARDNTSGTVLNYFNGSIDEVRIYNRALSAAEIKSLYDRGAPDKTNSSSSQAQGTGRLDSGLVNYWKFDENTGTSTADASTNAGTGTLTNGPTWATGQIGSGVDFDGTNDYIVAAATNQALINARQVTVSFWMKPRSSGYQGSIFASITNDGGGNGPFTNGFEVSGDSWAGTQTIRFAADGSTGDMMTRSTTALTLNVWTHVTVVWDGSLTGANTKFYINGALDTTTAQANGSGSYVASDGSAIMGATNGSAKLFDGQLDEVRVYDRVLSADEAGELYRLTTPTGVDTSLRGYWSFNGQDISGTSAFDRSGVGNTGTLTGGPPVVEGRVGQALSFDNVNDYVLAGSPSAVDNLETQGGGGMTASAWIYPESGGTFGGSIVGKRAAPSPGDGDWSFNIHQDGDAIKFYKSHSMTNLEATTLPGSIVLNKWQFVTATWSGGSTRSSVTFYIDGVLVPTSTSGGSDGVGTKDSDAAEVISISSQFLQFDGLIDEVRLYNRILPAAEIKSLYDASAPDKANTSISTPQGTGRLDSGLAGYWKLDENTGTSAADASTNGNTGTLTNGPTWTTGQIGSAVDFDGTDDYISLGTTLVSADSITVAAWVKGDAAVDGMPIIGQINGEEGSDHQCLIYDNAGTENIIFGNGVGGSVNIQVTGTGASLGTTWHHVVYTNSGTTNSIYLDGTKLVQTVSNALTTNTESNITIGRCWSGGGASYFNGLIDDVRIYRRTLSVDEVGQLYRLGAPTGIDTGLKGYWSFNGQDTNSTTAFDRSGAGNNGTLTNGPTVTEGKIGQALDFDGTNDHITLAANTQLDFGDTDDMTLTGWFYRDTSNTADVVVGKRNGSGVGETGYMVDIDATTDQLVFRASDGVDEYRMYSGSTFTTPGWHHFSVIWDQDSSSNSKIYIDGIADTSATSGTISSIDNMAHSVFFKIGISGLNADAFDGKIDEVRVYNRVLSASEIKALYSSGR